MRMIKAAAARKTAYRAMVRYELIAIMRAIRHAAREGRNGVEVPPMSAGAEHELRMLGYVTNQDCHAATILWKL